MCARSTAPGRAVCRGWQARRLAKVTSPASHNSRPTRTRPASTGDIFTTSEQPANSPAYVPPSATIEVLRRRADLLDRTRRFFAERGVLEVETPLLGRGLVVDAHIDPIVCTVGPAGPTDAAPEDEAQHYLLPSPEAPMKRLLAAGSGPIFQIARAFRQGETGRVHQPEFTMLEWYRPGLDYHALMNEVGALMRELLGIETWVKRTHTSIFQDILGVDPQAATASELANVARIAGIKFGADAGAVDRDAWLDVLFATCIEPGLDPALPIFIHDFPASQAALAMLSDGTPPVAQRFELIYGGMELCNGYQELLDASAHAQRFEAENARREAMHKARIAPDAALIAAIEHGLPPCAGVAVGFDRVVMLACGAATIDDVVAFSV